MHRPESSGHTWSVPLLAGLSLAAFAGASLLLALPAPFSLRFFVPPQGAEPLEVFAAPSHLPSGEHWVIVGSLSDLPGDATVVPLQAGVAVLEHRMLSGRALAVRVRVSGTGAGHLLQLTSAWGQAELAVERGQAVSELTTAANFAAEDLAGGQLVVKRDFFLYGYYPPGEGQLAALRIHNRTTGEWHRREYALERAEAEGERTPAELLPEGFEALDPLVTLPDTDGDGIWDFDEVEEPEPPRPEFLGVALAAGVNVLDLVAVAEGGAASWRTLEVYTAAAPAAPGF